MKLQEQQLHSNKLYINSIISCGKRPHLQFRLEKGLAFLTVTSNSDPVYVDLWLNPLTSPNKACTVFVIRSTAIYCQFANPSVCLSILLYICYVNLNKTLTVSLNKLSYLCSAFCCTLNLLHSHFYSLHLISYHFIFSSSSHLFYEEITIAIAMLVDCGKTLTTTEWMNKFPGRSIILPT
jgi:hypothetical protein